MILDTPEYTPCLYCTYAASSILPGFALKDHPDSGKWSRGALGPGMYILCIFYVPRVPALSFHVPGHTAA